MNRGLRIWVPGAALAIVAVLAGGWFVGAQPLLAAAATSDQSSVSTEAANTATRARLVGLTKAAAKVDALRTQDAVLRKAVPKILKPNTFIRRVNEVAALYDVTVKSIVPSPASAYAPAPSLAGSSTTTNSLAIGSTSPAITGAVFTVVPISVEVSGSKDGVLGFTQAIQDDQRLLAISSVATTTSDDGTVDAALGGVIYILKR